MPVVLGLQTLRASWGMQKKRLDGVIARRNILEKEVHCHHLESCVLHLPLYQFGSLGRYHILLAFEHQERIIPSTALLNTANVNFTVEQLRGAKAKLQILLNKSINDDLLIQALTIELAAARQVIFLLSSSLPNHKIMFMNNNFTTLE